jgi:long-chain acyl-CoA synthetase
VWTSYGEFGERVARARAGLFGLGVRRGDVVAIVANNCLEWAASCYATAGLGATFVPMYEAQRPDEQRFILNDCGAKVVLARAGNPHARLVESLAELPNVEHLIGIGLSPADPTSFDALLEAGARAPVEPDDPPPELIAAIIYTSGTTGRPKGVVLSHGNITSNIMAGAEVFPLSPDDRLLSFLPWAHSYGQLELHFGFLHGASLALNDDIKQLLANLAEVKPTMLVTVPRVFNRVYDVVRHEIGERPRFVQKLFENGVRFATQKRRGERVGPLGRLELSLDDKLIFQKIRERFGGRLKYVMCASAALGREVAELIDAVGITVYEGYGLTETSPIVAANTPAARRLGSVGKVIPGVRVVIDTSASDEPPQGEIIVYGPNVMQGYHNRPDENAKAFTADGGLRTGDLGYFDEDGFLYITGRIKEQYKLENGKYVMPGPLEEELKLSPFVSNVMLHGANRPYNVALVVVDEPAVRAWASEEGFALDDPTHDARVEELLQRELDHYASAFRSYEVPRRVLVTVDDWSTDNGLLTPTLKLKRRVVEERYGGALDALYATPPEIRPAPP